eukprot:6398988-Amphidinium_carterae.2
MRSKEDLPEMFLGERRPYCIYDLKVGMKLTGVVRRVFDRIALVDIGAERLARQADISKPGLGRRFLGFSVVMMAGTACRLFYWRLSVYHHKKPLDEYGMPMQHVQYEKAAEVYLRGACMDVWVCASGKTT